MFKVGDKVKIVKDIHCHFFDIGEIVEVIKVVKGASCFYYFAKNNNGKERFVWDEDITAITESPEEITINGTVYIPKPQEKHEWKFGDWAQHRIYGVVFVCGNRGCKAKVLVRDTSNIEFVNPETLTYISSAKIPA